MKYSFISIIASSNNVAKAKMLQLAILVLEDGDTTSKFESFIKPMPRLSTSEMAILTVDYSKIKMAAPFCEVALEIIPLLENCKTIFKDRTSERIFINSFKEIGFPIGRATYILEPLFKKALHRKTSFSLSRAMQFLQLDYDITNLMEECIVMEKIFFYITEKKCLNVKIPDPKVSITERIVFSDLPTNPGVYFFRNLDGQVIYVGKAINILKRVRSHFTAKEIFERELCRTTLAVDFEETGSETLALLLESHYITTLKPCMNTLQKKIINPYIITSKLDSKGILRIQPVQKSYEDSENEFYYNRNSVIEKILELQQKFRLCRRYAGIERSARECSDSIFCGGICKGQEDKNMYNARVKEALDYLLNQRPSYVLKLRGRHNFESAILLVKNGIYQGFGFINNEEQINSLADMEGYINNYSHNYFTSRIIDQFHKSNRNNEKYIQYY